MQASLLTKSREIFLGKSKTLYYKSCDNLPLWNFFKILENNNDLKYLVVKSSRWDYENIKLTHDLSSYWEDIINEYGELHKQSGISAKNKTRERLIKEWAKYIEEQALIKLLYFKSDYQVIKTLESRGYKFNINSTLEYWEALEAAAKRVHYHVSFMEKYSIQLKPTDEPQKNLFDNAMAFLQENNVTFDENITVKRYLILKDHINGRAKRGTI